MCTSCPELQTHKPGAAYRNPKPWERISALPHQTHPRHSLSTSDFSNSISPTAGTKNCDVIPMPLVHSVSSPSDSSSAGGLLVPPVGVLSPLCLCSPPVCARLSSQWPSAPACAACTGPPPAHSGHRHCVPRHASQTRGPNHAALCPSLTSPHAATTGTVLPHAHLAASWPPRFCLNIT